MVVSMSEEGMVPDQQMSATQTIVQEMTGMGAPQTTELGPMLIEVIALDGRFYLRYDVSGELAGLFPEGWYDVTEDASVFGMEGAFNIQQAFQLSAASFTESYFDAMENGIQEVEVLGEDTIDGVAVQRYRLVLNVEAAIEALGGIEGMSAMFGSDLGVDVDAMLEQIYDPENTDFMLEVAIGVEDGLIYEYSTEMVLDIVLGAGTFTDPMLAESEMTLKQTATSTLTVYDFDEPVEIVAPELSE
jgi:hypothetical protein